MGPAPAGPYAAVDGRYQQGQQSGVKGNDKKWYRAEVKLVDPASGGSMMETVGRLVSQTVEEDDGAVI